MYKKVYMTKSAEKAWEKLLELEPGLSAARFFGRMVEAVARLEPELAGRILRHVNRSATERKRNPRRGTLGEITYRDIELFLRDEWGDEDDEG